MSDPPSTPLKTHTEHTEHTDASPNMSDPPSTPLKTHTEHTDASPNMSDLPSTPPLKTHTEHTDASTPTLQTPPRWNTTTSSRPLERAVRGNSKLRAFLRQLGHMVRMNPALKDGFSDTDFYDVYMGDSTLTRSTTCLPWGWAGLVPVIQGDTVRYSNNKGGTFTGICPLVRLGPKRYAFTPDAWEAMLPVLESAKPTQLALEKEQVLRTLRAKRKRNKSTQDDHDDHKRLNTNT